VSGAAGPDPYLDPASGVLRNRLGITDAKELAQVEAALSASRLVDLERRRLPGRYDLAHLRDFHRVIHGDVYDWAGELRTVSIAKGSVFCLPQHLESYAADIFGRLEAADQLRGLARDPFITQLRISSSPARHQRLGELLRPLASTKPGPAWNSGAAGAFMVADVKLPQSPQRAGLRFDQCGLQS
jgi:hypothetical protein